MLAAVQPLVEDPRARRISVNFERFDRHAKKAEGALAAGDLSSAAAYASAAAGFAVDNHCGLFSSARLERVLTTIGKLSEGDTGAPRPLPTSVKRVLHVSTQVFPIGGHSKMIRLWIESDPTRQHSLALTQQRGTIPAELEACVLNQGGDIHCRLNRIPGGVLASANALRRIASSYDMIVLHTGNSDVVPSIAFAVTEKYPPVFFLNHADHLFWIGSSIAQIVWRHA